MEEEPVRLSLARERCSAADKQVEYTIANTTGQSLGVHPVPRLERNTDTGWQTVSVFRSRAFAAWRIRWKSSGKESWIWSGLHRWSRENTG